MVVNVPGGFTTGFSFFYSSVQSANVDVYSEVNKGGTKLATLSLVSNWRNDGCVGDPTGNFCHWDPIGVSFTGVAKSIDFAGAANRVGFDDITFGSVGKFIWLFEYSFIMSIGKILIFVIEPRNGGVIDDPHFKTW